MSVDEVGLPLDGTVTAIRSYRCRVLAGGHPLELAMADEIDADWQRERAANPALFNGPVILQNRLRFENGVVQAEGHVASFAAFLWWRKRPDLAGAFHLFGYPVLVSSDGALIAVEMAGHTSNPGQVYFAAGSLDPSDVVDGYCDLQGNMRREVLEETGLDLRTAHEDPTIYASYRSKKLTLFQLFHFAEPAEALVERIEVHMRDCAEQEISRAVVIRSSDREAHRYSPSMVPILDWYFHGRS